MRETIEPRQEGAGPEAVPVQPGHDPIVLRGGEARSWLARTWSSPLRYYLTWGLVFVAVPALLVSLAAWREGTFLLPEAPQDDRGMLEDLIFLSYFPMAGLLLVSARAIVVNAHEMLASLVPIVRFPDQCKDLGPEHRSTLERARFADMFRFFEGELAFLAFRRAPDPKPLPREYRWRTWGLRAMAGFTVLCGAAYLWMGSRAHWHAKATYGFDIWSSSTFLLGFWSRFAVELLLYVVLVPFVLVCLVTSVYLMQHALREVARRKAIRYVRFAEDQAGGFGEFGEHSLKHVLCLLPFLLPLVTYQLTYPNTHVLNVGFGLLVVGLPLIFFLPLMGARTAMNRAKRLEMQIIGAAAARHYEELKRSLEKGDKEEMERHSAAVEKGAEVFDSVAGHTAWPFNRDLLTRFGSLMATIGAVGLAKIFEML